MPKTPEQLAEEHWTWLESLLVLIFAVIRYLYKTAFIHGMKHGEENLYKLWSKEEKEPTGAGQQFPPRGVPPLDKDFVGMV